MCGPMHMVPFTEESLWHYSKNKMIMVSLCVQIYLPGMVQYHEQRDSLHLPQGE